jgi:TetR/AcrR family transcriptional repressor of nem operon
VSDTSEAIMDAAERRIRSAGYNGFSFREIAGDIGVKSSSVHHHFPTKDALAAAVARRYVDRFEQALAAETAGGTGRIEAWRRIFRRALVEDGQMCLCGALGTATHDIPAEVADEARRFFRFGMDNLAGEISADEAARVLSTLEGAMLLANMFGDVALFDQATRTL